MKNPYTVPPFNPPPPCSITYVWWSWRPLYPHWAQSCWAGATIEDAKRHLLNPIAKLGYYHNKLIRHDGITLVEVLDVPCERLDVWQEIARDKNGWRKPTDAQPIEGWDK